MVFRSRKEMELEEARKAGLAPAEVDDDGKEINPHIPNYMSSAPWYLNINGGKPSLKHQRKRKLVSSTDRKVSSKISTPQYACENCGEFTHDKKSCVERPSKLRAKTTMKHTAPIENVDDKYAETLDLSYDAKRDPWNGCDTASYYKYVVQMHEAMEEARTNYLKEQQLKKLGEKTNNRGDEISDEDDEIKVDESKQTDFAKVEKRVRTTGGGCTGTVRNLRIREDTAKYLLNLDVNSAHYDPKTRSMREDPLPDVDPNEKFYAGDNFERSSGQALEFTQMNSHLHEAFEKGEDVHMQGAPSQAELLYKNFKVNKEKLRSRNKDAIMERYGNAASEEEVLLPWEILLGQSEREVEYDRAGRLVKGEEMVVAKSKYEEDVYTNNHTSVWGSWWNERCWGYTCCHQMVKNSYCTGAAGIQAAEAARLFL